MSFDVKDVARSDREAFDRYRTVLTQSLCCVTSFVQWRVGELPGTEQKYLATTEDPLPLKTAEGTKYWLKASQWFHYDQRQVAPFDRKVTTDRYSYTLSEDPELATELITWHWHPHARGAFHQLPHMHVGHGHDALGKYSGWHLPTSRVSFEAIVFFLIVDLGVKPARADWQSTLEDCLSRFNKHRTWS